MSLDSWLGRREQNGSPPAKRQKPNFRTSIGDAQASTETSSHFTHLPSLDRSRGCSQAPKYTRQLALEQRLELEPPEIHWGRRSVQSWSVSDRSQGEEHISSLACLPDAPLALLGLDNGDLDIIECSRGQDGGPNTQVGRIVNSKHVPPGWPVVDIAAASSHNVVCASKRGTSVFDAASENITALREHDREITHVSHGFDKFALCGSEGFIGLLDTRVADSYSELVADSHSTLRGPKANRQRPAVTALTWAGPNLLASGSQADDTVKFWDIRYTRKSQVMSCQPQNSTRSREGGINSLYSDGDGSVWALTRDARILHMDSMTSKPLFCLESRALTISSPYQKFDFIPNSAKCQNPSRSKNCHPNYPLIASCSDTGVVLATKPSPESFAMSVDATFASVLRVSQHSSYPSKVTSLCWHPYTSELITIVANRAWEMWTYTGSTGSFAKPANFSLKL